MPKQLHDRLARQARKKGLKGRRRDAYIYGTMSKVDKMKSKSFSKRSLRTVLH